MVETTTLIEELAKKATPVKLINPKQYIIKLGAVFLLYGFTLQYIIGIRVDILQRLTNKLYVFEIIMLILIAISGLIASIIAMFPDNYNQKHKLKLPLPYMLSGIMLMNISWQIIIDITFQSMFDFYEAQTEHLHEIECALFIACASIIPSMVMFVILRRGATLIPMQAGAISVITISSLNAAILRLSEINDSATHLLIWHYIPIIILASFGALIGRFALKW
jgi:hypothetical protein